MSLSIINYQTINLEKEMYRLVNYEREIRDIHRLIYDYSLAIIAREHSFDMAINNFFDHINLKGEDVVARAKKNNYYFNTIGENIAEILDYKSIRNIMIKAHEGLMNSKGHKENILRKEFYKIGIGIVRKDNDILFTQNFS